MKKVGFIYDDIFLSHEMPPGHPESGERLLAIIRALKAIRPQGQTCPYQTAQSRQERHPCCPCRVLYVEKVMKFTGYFDPDTFISKHSVEAALYACRSGNRSD